MKAILNFSPGALNVPPDVKLKSVDLTVSLESLSFFLAQWRADSDGAAQACRGAAPVARRCRADRSAMVDVPAKAVTAREAVGARADPHVGRGARQIRAGVKKGDPLQTARLAGIMAAKQTSALIPLCHPLPLSHVDVALTRATTDTRSRDRAHDRRRPASRWRR